MNSHILITAKYLDRCLETGLFGVTAAQINLLANVHVGDTVFFLETQSGRIVGPLTVTRALFSSTTPIWSSAEDDFSYRICLSGQTIFESDVTVLWPILLSRAVSDAYAFNVFQLSAATLLPGEGDRLAQLLASSGHPISPSLKWDVTVVPCDLLQRDSKRISSEARLEAALLWRSNLLHAMLIKEGLVARDAQPAILNQVGLPGTQHTADIVLLSREHATIIELKKDAIDGRAIAQVIRYRHFWREGGRTTNEIVIGAVVAAPNNGEVQCLTYSILKLSAELVVHGIHGDYIFPLSSAKEVEESG